MELKCKLFFIFGHTFNKISVFWGDFVLNRTDLAVESYEEKESTKIDGVKVYQTDKLTVVDVLNENGAKSIGKSIGKYITLNVPSFENDTDIFDGRLEEFSRVLKLMLPKKCKSVLVVGLGNKQITADALGPDSTAFIFVTRHIMNEITLLDGFENLISVSAISTGVLGNTGVETAEIVKGIVFQTKPDCIIAIDALAAASKDRLGNTVQFSNVGIAPGSGVGNHRNELSKNTLGVPVVSVGIPTVISTNVLGKEDDSELFVTPRDIDKIIQQGAKLIGMGINVSLQPDLSVNDLLALVG